MGLVRTRMMETHSPSFFSAGATCGEISDGRAGSVVVVVVVVSPGSVVVGTTVEVVVVGTIVVVVVSLGNVVVGATFGQLVVRTRCVWDAGAEDPCGRVVAGALALLFGVDEFVGSVVPGTVVSTTVSVMGGNNASVSAGATAGGSLCSHDSNVSTMGPRPLFRAHDARLCCNGSLELASTYRPAENVVTAPKTTIRATNMRIIRCRVIRTQ